MNLSLVDGAVNPRDQLAGGGPLICRIITLWVEPMVDLPVSFFAYEVGRAEEQGGVTWSPTSCGGFHLGHSIV